MDEQCFDLPPLNLSLAHGLVAHAPLSRSLPDDRADALADTLVRVSQLVVDLPELATLSLGAASCITLRPRGQAGHLAIAPYPAELAETWQTAAETLQIRPIRPEDAAAHAALFARIHPNRRSNARRAGGLRAERQRSGGNRDGGGRSAVRPSLRATPWPFKMGRLIAWGRSQGMAAITGQILVENQADAGVHPPARVHPAPCAGRAGRGGGAAGVGQPLRIAASPCSDAGPPLPPAWQWCRVHR